MANNLKIKVNDISLPLNTFVQKTFNSVILGLLDSLDRVPQPINKVTIEINTPDKEENKE
jgi:hypothetical protein